MVLLLAWYELCLDLFESTCEGGEPDRVMSEGHSRLHTFNIHAFNDWLHTVSPLDALRPQHVSGCNLKCFSTGV